jgi:hypothetical protein
MLSGNGWFILAAIVVVMTAVSYALGTASGKKAKKQDEAEARSAKRRKDTEQNWGNRIRKRLESMNTGGNFAVESEWDAQEGNVVLFYRVGCLISEQKKMRISVDLRRGLKSLHYQIGQGKPREYYLTEEDLGQVFRSVSQYIDSVML